MSEANTSSNAAIEVSSPYFLGSSDNTSTILVSKVFDETGFATWKRSMTLALIATNKFCFVDGSLSSPRADSPLISNWDRVNSMVISWILNSLNKDIAESVLFFQTANEIWVELNQRYAQSNGAMIYQIQKQLYSIIQGSEDFSTYFTKIKHVLDELRMIQEVPTCTCSFAAILKKFMEDQCLIQLLMGLNDSYKSIRGQILMMSPLPTISTVYSILIHEE
ncbi:uncharacterized protein LOC111878586 [Lactuca sativa]|uniref:uncharacterized protein LOC111878586 n=1 Tax=Lactuca sativa TaxID=4236 RepID=UPI000CD7EE76|nr:uncharacterized protein LOC111878586 [Lactuca sativa]